MTQHAGDVVGSQGLADGRIKTNVAPKNIHTLFFLVVGDYRVCLPEVRVFWSLEEEHSIVFALFVFFLTPASTHGPATAALGVRPSSAAA